MKRSKKRQSLNPRKKLAHVLRYVAESLESRLLLSAVSWTGAGDGLNWTDANNWSTGALPGPGDDVTINAAGNPTITLASGSQAVNSLVTNNPLDLTGGTLVIGTTAQLNANLALSGGTIQGGTITQTGSAEVMVQSGTLDGVTANTNIDLTQYYDGSYGGFAGTLIVLDGLTLNASLLIGNASGSNYGRVYFGDPSTVAGSLTTTGAGTVLFGGYNNAIYNGSNLTGASGTLTIGPGVTIVGKNGSFQEQYANGSIVNQGTIDAAGGAITMSGSWSNSGTMEAGNAGTLDLGGSFTGAGGVQAAGGTVNVTGTLAGNLALTAATGSWNLAGGSIVNGTYSATGGRSLAVQYGTLDGVTANANIDLSQTNSSLTVLDGLVLNASLLLGNASGSTYGRIYFGNYSSAAAAGSLTTTDTGTVLF